MVNKEWTYNGIDGANLTSAPGYPLLKVNGNR